MFAASNVVNQIIGSIYKSVSYTAQSLGGSQAALFEGVVPKLTFNLHKGSAGRICVIGGSEEYTGAPYYAAMSALKTGADLAFVVCHPNAAVAIKSYSPELIVYPSLVGHHFADRMNELAGRINVVILGPGLGRSAEVTDCVHTAIQLSRRHSLPMVIDADGLHFITQRPDSIAGVQRAVLTPNIVEFRRLFRAVFGDTPDESLATSDAAKSLAEMMGVTVVVKGQQDVITDGKTVLTCKMVNSPRRCGGQGDLLSGSLATFLHWVCSIADSARLSKEHSKPMLAAYAACCLTRECNRLAFKALSRSATTMDMISLIHPAFSNLFE